MKLWKQTMTEQQPGVPILYSTFPYKQQLNNVLRAEQHGICCYCQRRIDHHEGNPKHGSHNEHLYPEHGQPNCEQLQMEYTNIYACCIDSQGHPKREKHLRYCGEAKEDKMIPTLVQDEKCASYFRYNVLGEIIPNGCYDKWEDYTDNESTLSDKVLDAYQCIKVLNLNCVTLINARYEAQQVLMTIVKKWSADELKGRLAGYSKSNTYPEFYEMCVQYIQRRIDLLSKRS